MENDLPATKILASLRTEQYSASFLEEIIQCGATLFRYNFTFFDIEKDDINVSRTIQRLRKAAERLGVQVGIVADIPGPALKTAIKSDRDINLRAGQGINFYDDPSCGLAIKHDCRDLYGQLQNALAQGELLILIDHAHAVLSVKSVDAKRKVVNAVAVNDALIRHNKNISFPGCHLELEPITQDDRRRLEYITKRDFDIVFQSFAQSANYVEQMRQCLRDHNAGNILVVVKVETDYAVKENLDEIVEVSDGVIVARGHLADELSERLMLPIYQREIIKSAKKNHKPVIVATELYYSIVESYYPNRPDMDNVFSAVQDGTDVLFLSGETTNSKDPCRIVQMLRKQLNLTEDYLGTGAIARPRIDDTLAARKGILTRGVYPMGGGI